MTTYKQLKKKYCEEKKQTSKVWNGEELFLASEQIKLLSTPELVEMYITKYRLWSASSEMKLLSTPELLEMYIAKYGISENLKKIIIERLE